MADTEVKVADDVMAAEEDGDEEVRHLKLWQDITLTLRAGGD
jgi:hypothetical protein